MPGSDLPNFVLHQERKQRQKNTCYSVFLTQTPEQSQIFVGTNAWNRAEHFMKGKPHTHKGFSNQLDAQRWMAEQNTLNTNTAGVQHQSPKEDARALYPERVATARLGGRTLYYTDCSFERGRFCGLGVWNATQCLQMHTRENPKEVNHIFVPRCFL